MNCLCGFKFAGPGEFRNCDAFVTKEGHSGVTCPKCQKSYIKGEEVNLVSGDEKDPDSLDQNHG